MNSLNRFIPKRKIYWYFRSRYFEQVWFKQMDLLKTSNRRHACKKRDKKIGSKPDEHKKYRFIQSVDWSYWDCKMKLLSMLRFIHLLKMSRKLCDWDYRSKLFELIDSERWSSKPVEKDHQTTLTSLNQPDQPCESSTKQKRPAQTEQSVDPPRKNRSLIEQIPNEGDSVNLQRRENQALMSSE